MFDTCCSHSIVSAEQFRPETCETQEFAWIDPSVVIKSRGTVNLTLDFGQDYGLSWTFHVMDNVNVNLIGLDFMSAFDISVHPARRQIVFDEGIVTQSERNVEPRVFMLTESLSAQKLRESLRPNGSSPPFQDRFPEVKERNWVEVPAELGTSDAEQQLVLEDDSDVRTPEQRIRDIKELDEDVRKLLLEFTAITDADSMMGKGVPGVVFDIQLTSDKPIIHKPRNLSRELRVRLKRLLRKYHRRGIIRRSLSSKYAHPCHVVLKANGKIRLTLDLRDLNGISLSKKFYIPRIVDLLAAVGQSKAVIFSTIDLSDGYYQINASEATTRILTFSTVCGNWSLTRMAMGHKNSAEFFQSIMVIIFDGVDFVLIYFDDILVFSSSKAKHLEHLRKVFGLLRAHNLIINPEKCHFAKSTVKFLGYEITPAGVRPLRDRCEAILNMAVPRTHSALRSYLGIWNWNRKFVHRSAEALAPMYKMLDHTKKNQRLKWTDKDQLEAFKLSKQMIVGATMLTYYDPMLLLRVYTDASDIAIGSALMQVRRTMTDEIEEPVAFFSRPLTAAEAKHSPILKEFYAVRDALRAFHYYVHCRSVEVYTDNKSVFLMCSNPDKIKFKPLLYRIFEEVLQYQPTVCLLSSKENILADCLSRNVAHRDLTSSALVDGNEVEEETVEMHVVGLMRMCHLDADHRQLLVAQKTDVELQGLRTMTGRVNCELIDRVIEGTEEAMTGDISTGHFRPFVTAELRNRFFHKIHDVAHPGIKRSQAEISRLLYWPSLNKDVAELVRTCEQCARNKVVRHEKTELIKFQYPQGRFRTIQMDFTGPLPEDNGFRYILVIKDRATRYAVMVPTVSQGADELIRVFLHRWVAYFGVPELVISDNYSTFRTAQSFVEFLEFLGVRHDFTNTYTPRENGLCERVNRVMKEALRCQERTGNWSRNLALINLSLNNLQGDEKVTANQIVFGMQLHMPGTLFNEENEQFTSEEVANLMRFVSECKDCRFREHPSRPVQHLQGLENATHVYLRAGNKPGALQERYSGPHSLLSLDSHSAYIMQDNQTRKVARDRLKPAGLLPFHLADLDSMLACLRTQDNGAEESPGVSEQTEVTTLNEEWTPLPQRQPRRLRRYARTRNEEDAGVAS